MKHLVAGMQAGRSAGVRYESRADSFPLDIANANRVPSSN
jgi:hypothetical protein